MNPPRIKIFTDPRPIDCLTRYYSPPQHQSDLIGYLLKHQYYPMVEGQKLPKIEDIRHYTGFIVLDRPRVLINVKDYVDGKILASHTYLTEINDEQVKITIEFFSELYGVPKSQKVQMYGDDYASLKEQGCLMDHTEITLKQSEILYGSDNGYDSDNDMIE